MYRFKKFIGNIKRVRKVAFIVALFLVCTAFITKNDVKKINAASYDAKTFVQTFGGQVKFIPDDNQEMTDKYLADGQILYGTEGTTAVSTGIRYSTIGWKVNVDYTDGAGRQKRQEIYFKLGGTHMQRISEVSDNGTEYNLYSIRLSTLRNRMSNEAVEAMNAGRVSINLDACVTLRKNGRLLSAMDDNGCTLDPKHFYTNHAGIANAAPWRKATKDKLKSYFNKNIVGLLIRVEAVGDEGVASTSGSGVYLYGTRLNVSLKTKKGYDFKHWKVTTGGIDTKQRITTESFQTDAIINIKYVAVTEKRKTKVVFHRNIAENDTKEESMYIAYGDVDKVIPNFGWSKEGYHQKGWSLEDRNGPVKFDTRDTISTEWALKKWPRIDLYGQWEENSYRIEYNGNGARSGHIPGLTVKYNDFFTTANNKFVTPIEESSYLGWSTSNGDLFPTMKEKENISVAELVNKLGISHSNGATITIYAIWNYWPVVETQDLFYTLEDAKNGKITEQELSKNVKATDREDGLISYGVHEKNSFTLVNYSPDEFTSLTSDGEVTENVKAIDQHGAEVEKQFRVHIVDTTPVNGKDVFGKIRFIDKKHRNTLQKYSVWKTAEFSSLLGF